VRAGTPIGAARHRLSLPAAVVRMALVPHDTASLRIRNGRASRRKIG
jgi:hypothetical protein